MTAANRVHAASRRLSALLQALANGAVELALAGHLSPGGKGMASPTDLVDDLFGYLQASAAVYHGQR